MDKVRFADPRTDPQARAALQRLLDDTIKPHAEEILRIVERNRPEDVALVFHEPMGAEAEQSAREHGWPERPVSLMPAWMYRNLQKVDPVTEKWLLYPRPGVARVFVVMHKGTLLLNSTERGWAPEPGSLDGMEH